MDNEKLSKAAQVAVETFGSRIDRLTKQRKRDYSEQIAVRYACEIDTTINDAEFDLLAAEIQRLKFGKQARK